MQKIKLKIGPVVIELVSSFLLRIPAQGESELKYRHFIYKGNEPAEITVEVKPRALLPAKTLSGARPLFTNIHHERKEVAWIFADTPARYVVDYRLSVRRKIMTVNKAYTKAAIYLSGKSRGFEWSLEDVLYDCLQMILIGYCADKGGVLVHSAGIRDDSRRQGYVFSGPSGAGKSTTARIWHACRGVRIFNDDRILVQERAGRFFIFGTPWHGNFSEYTGSITGTAALKKLFFIYHAPKNSVERLAFADAFLSLYPNIFPVLWDRKGLDRQIDLCRRLTCSVAAYRLGLVKDRSVVNFVRSIK